MARETKVGLIVGLAFIICFAIILANRGQPFPAPATSTPYPPPAGRGASSPSPMIPASDFTIAPRASLSDALTNDSSSTRSGAAFAAEVPSRTEAALSAAPAGSLPSNGGEVMVLGGDVPLGASTDSAPLFAEAGASVDHQARSTTDPFRAEKRAGGFAPGESSAWFPSVRSAGKALPASLARQLETDSSQGLSSAPPLPAAGASPEAPVVPSVSHTVAAGDSLSKIAARYYGAGSKKRIDAIYHANRQVLKSRDELPVGTVLRVPLSAEPTPPAANGSARLASASGDTATGQRVPEPPRATAAKPIEKEAKKAASAGRAFQWYQVRKNDRYASIAREQLGDGSRWREIFELNKDKFPDPERIREGVRIKLPMVAKSDGKTRA